MNKCVYQHIRLDTNEIFYIGIGDSNRPYVKNKRTSYWNNIVNKCGYKVEILFSDLTMEEAKNIEISLIKKYGRKDLNTGSLINMTDGGDGRINIIVSEETRKRQSIAFTGRKQNEEWIDRKRRSNKQVKEVIDTSTGIIYYCPREVSKIFNIKYSTLIARLNGQNINKTNFKYLKDGCESIH